MSVGSEDIANLMCFYFHIPACFYKSPPYLSVDAA